MSLARCVAVLCTCSAVAAANSRGTSPALGILRLSTAPSPAACNASSFAVKADTQGLGLELQPLGTSLDSCVAACCGDSGCAVWSWSATDVQCWTGGPGDTAPNDEWTTGTRPVPPPTPPPHQLPRLTPFPSPASPSPADARTHDLAGQWDFNPAVGAPEANWTTIAVPGE
jgi:hypothetical protein